MARVAKYGISSLGNLFAHMERRTKVNKETGSLEYVKFGNRDIDTRFTPLNFRLWPPLGEDIISSRGLFCSSSTRDIWASLKQNSEESVLFRFRRIFHGVQHSKRKDLKCLCDWCISLPDEIPCDRMPEFFDVCLRYCIRLYGAENIVGAWAHVDEDHRPHLDVCFVPVLDRGTEKERISAKDLLNRGHLSDWHGGLTSFVQKQMNISNPGILNGRTLDQGGNRTVKQMKAHDKHYAKTKGREVSIWRSEQLKRLERSDRGVGVLQNMLTDADSRRSKQLLPQRPRSIKERLTRT